MSVCSKDCLNCPYDDCICDELTAEDYAEAREREKELLFPKTRRQKQMAAYQKAYRAENKEQLAAYQKAYRAENKEQLAARQKAYRAENKEQIAAYQKAYYAEHKERIAAHRKERRTEPLKAEE